MKDTSKITEFHIEKGLTVTEGDKWNKKSLELTVKLPEQYSEIDFQAALDQAEYTIDTWLGTTKATAPQIPDFNPEELMKHKGWKARKTGEGQYAEGSLAWGWDYADKFSKEVIAVLKKGPLQIAQYEFSLNEEQTLVSAKKTKEK